MASILDLRTLLGKEYELLPQYVLKKIEGQLSSYEDLVQALKHDLSEAKASSEKNCTQLTNELKSINEQLKKEASSSQEFKSKANDLEERLHKAQSCISDVQNSHRECGNQILQLQSTIKQLSHEKLSMAEVLERRDEEIRNLEENLKSTCNLLASANAAKMDSLLKVQEAEIACDNCKHQMKRLSQEKDLLNEQVSNLNREISEKSVELLRLRKDKSSRVLELQAELDLKTQELELAQSQSSDRRESLKVQDKRVNVLSQRVREVQEAQHKSEEQFTLEISAHIQLAQLHKSTAEELQVRVKELMKTIEEIHETCSATANDRDEAILALREAQSEFEDKIKELEAEMELLNKKLAEAQKQLEKMTVVSEEALERMFPDAAASNRLLQKGMSLTEMYSTYRNSEEELLSKTRENKALKEQLKDLHNEIEEREPIIKVRMQELKKATETIALLEDQVHNTSQYLDKLESERDDAVRMTGYHKREQARMKQTAADLTTQVRFLLKEMEETSGRSVPMESDSKFSSLGQSATGMVISEHLVTFKNIQELQEQNQKLLAVSRELGEQLEDRDMQLAQEKTSELKEHMENVMREFEELKEERKVQSSIVESIAQQRDSLRAALMHSTGTSSIQASPVMNQSPKRNTSRELSDQSSILDIERAAASKAEATLEELKEEFKVYKKEAKVNATMLQDENNKLRDTLSEVRLQMAKSSSMLEFTQGRLEQTKSNLEMERKELSVLRESSLKYGNSISQHQQTISMLNKELYTAQDKLSHAEVTVDNLKCERDLLKATEVRLLQEREAARSQNNNQAKVMSHLQAVKNNLDRLESEAQVKQNNEIKGLREERDILRSQLDTAHREYVAAVKAWEVKLNTLQGKVSEEQEKCIKSREELVDSYANMHNLKMELSEVQSKLKAAEEKINKTEGSEGAGTRGMNLLRQQLNATKFEVQNLQQKLGNTQQNANHFSSMADDLSKQLKEAKETHVQSILKMESILGEKTIHNKTLMDQITEMSEQQNILSEELFRSSNEKDNEIQSLKEEASRLRNDAEALEQKATLAHQMELQFQIDRKAQDRLLVEAQEKYQRELMLHAQDSQELLEDRNKTSALETRACCAEDKCLHLEEMLEELRSAWGQQEEAFKGEAQTLRQKAKDAEAQCTAVHQQLELMSSQLSAMKSTPDWTLVGGGSQETPTEHYQEVIRFLRKDKDIAVTQFNACQSEAKRLKIRVDLLESQMKEIEKDLLEERSRNQSQAASQAEHRDIMQKLEMMNLLHESNRCLREEKEAIVRANTELKEQVLSLQSQLSSLGQSTQDLTSQVEMLSAENSAVRGEIKKWQSRAATLTEQSRRHDPQDFRRMEEENAILKEDMVKMKEEMSRLQAEAKQHTAHIAELLSELLTAKKSVEVAASKETNTLKELEKLKADSAENNKTTIQVKKIARKYKMQYDELRTKLDELEAAKNASQLDQEASLVAHQAALEAARAETTEKAEAKAKEALEKAASELAKLKEDLDRAVKAEELAKTQVTETNQRTNKIMLQAKKKLESLQAERDASAKSSTDLTKENKELKAKIITLEALQEENNRLNAQRSLLEARSAKLEKEVKLLREVRERLEKQLEDMAQRKQVSRPSTSAGPASSTIQEPLTANIRPMTPPVVTSGSGLRHPPHPTPAASRTTPTASIRPMAIGTSGSTSGSSVVAASSSSGSSSTTSASPSVASSSTGGHSTRMAAVPPTSASINSEGEPVLVSTAHVLPTSSVPQATVQPTPAMPTLVTPLAPPTPPSATIQGPEQTASSSADAGMEEPRSHLGETEEDRCVSTSSTSSGSVAPPAVLSGSVSVASTSPQTQVVAPTLKRHRDEEPTSVHSSRDSDLQPDTTGSSVPQLKRLRLAGEAQPQQQHLMERASVVTSGGGVLSSLPSQLERASSSTVLAVTAEQMNSSREESSLGIPASTVAAVSRQQEDMPPERPGVIVTPEPQPIVVSESASSSCTSTSVTQHQPQHLQSSLATLILQQEAQEVPSEEPKQAAADLLSYSQQEEESPDDKASESTVPKSVVEFSMDDSRDDQSKVFAEEGEEYEEEVEEEEEECMEEEGETYDNEKMDEVRFSQDEDEMAEEGEGSPIEPDTDDITENAPEDQIIDDADEDESQMDAQDTSAVPMVPGDTVLVQGSSPSSTAVRVPSMVGDAPSTSSILSSSSGTESISATITPASSSLQQQPHHRPPVLPRVPPRSERLPSSQTSGFEDGDDGIVPSTPTLFVPRRGDGFAEAISSPHVPHGRFLFSSSVEATPTQGISQLASQGALGVDDTRMDLSQFDEGSGRSVPTTPLQVSPPADATVSDLPELLLRQQQESCAVASSSSTTIPSVQKLGTSTGSNSSELVTSTQGIPTITVTGHDEAEEVSQSSNSSGGNGSQEAQPLIEEPSCTEEGATSNPTDGPVITEITSLQEDKSSGDKEGELSTNPDEGSSESASTSIQGTTRRVNRKPIVWKPTDGSRVGRGGPFSTPTRGGTRGVARGFKSSRGGPPGSGSSTRGPWSGRGWRGAPGGPSQ